MEKHGWFFPIVLAALVSGSGCAATMTAIQYKDLATQTRMSATIFLPPVVTSQENNLH